MIGFGHEVESADRSRSWARIRVRGSGVPITVVVVAGVALRVEQYLHRRSLWFDEALLALNVVGRPLRRLVLGPLAFHQGAPPGFVVAERVSVHLVGDGEYGLRLVPLLSGCLAVVVFAHLAYRVVSGPAPLLATALVAFSPLLVYYSAECKQYSTDVLFTMLILDLAVGLLLGPPGLGRVAAFCLGGRAGLASAGGRPCPACVLAGRVSAAAGGACLAAGLGCHGVAVGVADHDGSSRRGSRRCGMPGPGWGCGARPAGVALPALLLAFFPLALLAATVRPIRWTAAWCCS